MKKASLAEVKDHLSRYLHDAEKEQVVITRHGKPAGVLIGFETEDDRFEYRMANDPAFLERIEKARTKIKEGKVISWKAIKNEMEE
jgi:prevent-host-death family protein